MFGNLSPYRGTEHDEFGLAVFRYDLEPAGDDNANPPEVVLRDIGLVLAVFLGLALMIQATLLAFGVN